MLIPSCLVALVSQVLIFIDPRVFLKTVPSARNKVSNSLVVDGDKRMITIPITDN